MLQCEGYKMFKGIIRVVPKNPVFPIRDIEGTWLYKPDTKCWYCKGSSYPEEICVILKEE